MHEIGNIYESEYKFKEALECYEKEIQCTPFFQFGYIDASKVLVKLDKKEEALKLLLSTKKSKYYKYEFKDVIKKNVDRKKLQI